MRTVTALAIAATLATTAAAEPFSQAGVGTVACAKRILPRQS